MTDRIITRGAELVAARVTQDIAKLADVLANDVPPDVTVTAQVDGIALSGVALRERAMTDVRLNTIPMFAKAALS